MKVDIEKFEAEIRATMAEVDADAQASPNIDPVF